MTGSHRTMLQDGDIAPDFELQSQTGQSVRLYDLLAREVVVLYFYLRDATPA